MIKEHGKDTGAWEKEIDGLVYVDKAGHVQPGDFIEVEITDSDTHDLYAIALTNR